MKNYKLRSKTYRMMGLGVIGGTTTSGFLAYQMLIDWSNFEEEIQNFVVVQQETLKLNLTLALPSLVGMLVFLFIAMKKNKDFFQERMSLNILFALFMLYLVYSVIEVTMVALAGAFVGTTIDELIFMPLSKSCKLKAEEQGDLDKEYTKEMRRIEARKKAESDFNGSV